MRSEEVVLWFSLLLLWVPLCFQICLGGSILKVTQNITHLSPNAIFELGFFSPGVDSGEKRYLGIWYHLPKPQTVVWVANRDYPVADSSGVFRIAEDGNVVVEYASKTHWSSNLQPSSSTNRTLKLLDSGNLVLQEGYSETYLWESFQNPTDTFLPGMKMDGNLSLTCWRDSADPAPGNFVFKLGHRGTLVVVKHSQLYWRELLDESDRNIYRFLGLDTSIPKNLSKPQISRKSRLVMNSSGEIQFLKWDEDDEQWEKSWSAPASKCDEYDYCGSFGICDVNNLNLHPCKCLPGFRPNGEIGGKGCVRKSTSCTIDTNVTFLNLTNIKVSDPPDEQYYSVTKSECEFLCLNYTITSCPQSQCQAYSYSFKKELLNRDDATSRCEIWTGNLSTLEVNGIGDRNLSVLVKRSDIGNLYLLNSSLVAVDLVFLYPNTGLIKCCCAETTAQSCEPCGTYEIPYPLSTGPNCGDPTYNKFNCNQLTDNLTFMMPGGNSYQVTWIDEATRMFYIKIDDSYSCGSRNSTPKSPFSLTGEGECSKNDVYDGTIKVNWAAAPEAPCRKPSDCENWLYSTCIATSDGDHRCRCHSPYKWNNSIMICAKEG